MYLYWPLIVTTMSILVTFVTYVVYTGIPPVDSQRTCPFPGTPACTTASPYVYTTCYPYTWTSRTPGSWSHQYSPLDTGYSLTRWVLRPTGTAPPSPLDCGHGSKCHGRRDGSWSCDWGDIWRRLWEYHGSWNIDWLGTILQWGKKAWQIGYRYLGPDSI